MPDSEVTQEFTKNLLIRQAERFQGSISLSGSSVHDFHRDLLFAYPDGQFLLQIPELELGDPSVVFAGPSGSGKTTCFI